MTYIISEIQNQLISIDFGADKELALANIQELNDYAKEFFGELDTAQGNVYSEISYLRRMAEVDLKNGYSSQEEYESTIKALDVSQGITGEACESKRKEYQEIIQTQLDALTAQLDKTTVESVDLAGTSFWSNYVGVISEYQDFYTSGDPYDNQEAIAKARGNAINEAKAMYEELYRAIEEGESQLNLPPITLTAEVQLVYDEWKKASADTANYYTSRYATGYASGTASSVSDFLAGENGPEFITNSPARTVYTAEETAEIFRSYREMVMFIPALQRAMASVGSGNSVSAPTVNTAGGTGGTTFEIHSSPTIYANGSAEELDEKLKQYNEQLISQIDEHLREQRENEERSRFN